MSIDPVLLEMLVCPACRRDVTPNPDGGLKCVGCGRVYPVRDGVAVMLVDEATPPASDPEGSDPAPGA